MKEYKKIFWYAVGIIFVIFIALGISMYKIKSDFDAKIAAQNEYYNSQIESLSETLSNDMMAVQNLIRSADDLNKNRYRELNSSIYKVQAESQTAKTQLEKQIATMEVSGTDFSKISQQSLPSVVSVLTNIGQGSGAIISSDGQIVTNYHVIDGAKTISVVTYDKTIYKVDVLGYDDLVDIAVLKIRANETFDELKMGDSSNVEAGQGVVALGNPYGLDFTVTQGIISAIRKGSNNLEYLQIDVPINPGNSGGPLIDATGSIIGIVTSRVQGAEGLGFAIPSNTVKSSVSDIVNI